MIKDYFVCVKVRKEFHEQKPVSFVGKCTAFNDHWVVLDAKRLMVSRAVPSGVIIEEKSNAVLIPAGSIESIRVLPKNFDMDKLKTDTQDQALMLVVDGSRNVFLGLIAEG